jgi:hypothetical protein
LWRPPLAERLLLQSLVETTHSWRPPLAERPLPRQRRRTLHWDPRLKQQPHAETLVETTHSRRDHLWQRDLYLDNEPCRREYGAPGHLASTSNGSLTLTEIQGMKWNEVVHREAPFASHRQLVAPGSDLPPKYPCVPLVDALMLEQLPFKAPNGFCSRTAAGPPDKSNVSGIVGEGLPFSADHIVALA